MSDDDRAPIAVGGVGGSGTRVVAQVLDVLGIALGTDLNPAWDNLSFALLMKHARWFGSPAKRRARAGAALDAFERATTAGGEALSTRQRVTVVRAALATAAFEQGFAGRGRWAFERARRLLGAQPPVRPGSAWG